MFKFKHLWEAPGGPGAQSSGSVCSRLGLSLVITFMSFWVFFLMQDIPQWSPVLHFRVLSLIMRGRSYTTTKSFLHTGQLHDCGCTCGFSAVKQTVHCVTFVQHWWTLGKFLLKRVELKAPGERVYPQRRKLTSDALSCDCLNLPDPSSSLLQ